MAAVMFATLAATVLTALVRSAPAAAGAVSCEPPVTTPESFQEVIFPPTPTALTENGNNFEFTMANWDQDARPDLVAIKRSGTSPRSTELHVISGGSDFSQVLVRIETALKEEGADFDFSLTDWDHDSDIDLAAVKKNNTVSRRTEVHILSGSSGFREFVLQASTALPETGSDFDFLMTGGGGGGRPDLIAVRKNGTETRCTEVHILSGESVFQQFTLRTGTALPQAGGNVEFALTGAAAGVYPDLAVIKRNRNGSSHTEVYVLSASSGFQQFILRTSTALPETAGNFEFAMADWDHKDQFDLAAIQRNNPVSRSNEVRILKG